MSAVCASAQRREQAILVDQIGGQPSQVRAGIASSFSAGRSKVSGALETEKRAFELMNAERQASGLRMLEWSDDCAELARSHARNMATNKFFSHRGSNGETVDGRAKQMGIRWLGIGENIATLRGYDDPAAAAVENWMRSTGHKKNILNDRFQISAVGAAVADDGTIYFAQVFIMR